MTMSHPAPDTLSSSGQDLMSVFLSLETPAGYREELVGQEIVVTPPPDGDHEDIIGFVIRALMRQSDADVNLLPNKGLITPHGRFIPDLTAATPRIFKASPPWAECDGVELVLEVTSGRAENDRKYKRLGYASAGIPLYLLVDRERRQVTVFSEPDGDDYRASSSVEFGGKLRVDAPFDCDLDTSTY